LVPLVLWRVELENQRNAEVLVDLSVFHSLEGQIRDKLKHKKLKAEDEDTYQKLLTCLETYRYFPGLKLFSKFKGLATKAINASLRDPEQLPLTLAPRTHTTLLVRSKEKAARKAKAAAPPKPKPKPKPVSVGEPLVQQNSMRTALKILEKKEKAKKEKKLEAQRLKQAKREAKSKSAGKGLVDMEAEEDEDDEKDVLSREVCAFSGAGLLKQKYRQAFDSTLMYGKTLIPKQALGNHDEARQAANTIMDLLDPSGGTWNDSLDTYTKLACCLMGSTDVFRVRVKAITEPERAGHVWRNFVPLLDLVALLRALAADGKGSVQAACDVMFEIKYTGGVVEDDGFGDFVAERHREERAKESRAFRGKNQGAQRYHDTVRGLEERARSEKKRKAGLVMGEADDDDDDDGENEFPCISEHDSDDSGSESESSSSDSSSDYDSDSASDSGSASDSDGRHRSRKRGRDKRKKTKKDKKKKKRKKSSRRHSKGRKKGKRSRSRRSDDDDDDEDEDDTHSQRRKGKHRKKVQTLPYASDVGML